METLELKDIAAYLPYGLKGIYPGNRSKFIRFNIGTSCKGDDYSICIGDDELLPILRPMSDLTKEITHKGEKFVPLVEIAKTSFPYWNWRIRNGIAIALKDNIVIAKLSYEVSEGYFSYSSDKGGSVKNWPYIIDKLSELMFDYRGLIPAKLAIDANTLLENPYEK